MTQQQTSTHKSQRSVTRMLGQGIDANGNVTGLPIEVRLAHIFAQRKRTKSAAGEPLDKPRYDTVVLIPKLSRDPAQCSNYAAVAAHCMEAAMKAWQQWPQGGKWPIQDGDIPHPQKLKPGQTPLTPQQVAERNKWREGSWIIEVTNYMDPGPRVSVLQNGQIVDVPSQSVGGTEFYKSGDYGYVSLNGYTFHNKTFGVNFGFEGLLFIRPGEKIGSSGPRSAAQMFAGVPGIGAPAAGAMPSVAPAPHMPTPGQAPIPPAPAPVAPLAPAPVAPAPVAPAAPAPHYPGAPPTAPVAPLPPAPQVASGLPPFPPAR